MLRELLLALALVALLGVGSTLAASASASFAPAAVSWNAALIGSPNVTLGAPIAVRVTGPPSGTFNVTLSGQPPLVAAPIFTQAYVEPNASAVLKANATATGASLTASVPTAGLAYGPYSLTVSNTSLGFEFAAFAVGLVQGVNGTYLWQLYNVTLARQQYLSGQVANLQGQIAKYQADVNGFFAVLATTLVGLPLSFYVYLRARDGNRPAQRMVEAFERVYHAIFKRSATSDPWDPLRSPPTTPSANPERVWVLTGFPQCAGCVIPMTVTEANDHGASEHGLAASAVRPRLRRSRGAQKHIETTRTTEVAPARRLVRKAVADAVSDGDAYAEMLAGGA